jgi:hypothetical protein
MHYYILVYNFLLTGLRFWPRINMAEGWGLGLREKFYVAHHQLHEDNSGYEE